MIYERWPFVPAAMRTPEQEQRWWAECYLPDPATALFAAASGAAALVGGPGSGKTTTMAYVTRQITNDLLIRYDTLRWPNNKRPWVANKGHIGQIMAAAATEIVAHLEREPEHFNRLDELNLGFLYWLVGSHLNRRTLVRLLSRIAQATEQSIDIPKEVEPLYKTDTVDADVWGQIGELAELCAALGFARIVIITDLNEAQAFAVRSDLDALLASLDLLQHASFAIRLTLPDKGDLVEIAYRLSRGQLQFMRLDESEEFIRRVLARHMAAATGDACYDLGEVAEPPVLARAKAEMKRLYGRPHTLAGQLQWARTLLDLVEVGGGRVADADAAALVYYTQHVPLQLADGRQGVWRGPQYIPLDKVLYDALRELFVLAGTPSPQTLISMAGSATNLNTLMSRLRAKIEPPGEWRDEARPGSDPAVPPKRQSVGVSNRPELYIHNRRDLGYWLENFVPLNAP